MKKFIRNVLPIDRADQFYAAILFLVYFLIAKASLYVYFTFNTTPILIWPPIGIALAILIFKGYKMLLPIILAQFLALATESRDIHVPSFISAFGYAIQMILAVYLLKELHFTAAFNKVRDTLNFILVALLVTSIEPLIATAYLSYSNMIIERPLLTFTREWTAGIFSLLVFTTLVFTWHPFRKSFTARSRSMQIERTAAFSILLIIDYLLFWTQLPQYLGISVIFLLPAVLLWFALRFHPRWLTLAVFMTSIVSIAGSLATVPLLTLSDQLFADQIYISFVAAIFFVLAAAIEEPRTAYAKLEQAYESTSAADKAKSNFIAILAHELRNPLAPIVTSLEILKKQKQNNETLEIIENAHEHTVMMRRLLDDLLDTARLTQNKIRLQKQIVDLRHLIDQSIESVKEYTESLDRFIQVSMPKEEIWLNADPIRVKQILINLLNNACKFSTDRIIKLDCYTKDHRAIIRITDTGIGIEEEMYERIFEPFKQVDDVSRYSTGLGIGLFLTKRLTELHGGTIEVQSEGAGKGSTFTVSLPLAKKPATETKVSHNDEPTALRILVVDDNKAAADILQKLLLLHGHDAITAYSGKEALSLLEDRKIQVMLLDIAMPDMNGYEVTRVVRANGWNGTIIALSGYGQETDRLQSLKAGFNYHLVKPVSIGDIMEALARSKIDQK